jgi:hypothetical protein
MIIRRYRSISKPRGLQTYFNEGLFSNHLTQFKDNNEGILKHPGDYSTLRGALAASAHTKRRRMDDPPETVSEEEFEDALDQFHEDARHQHFANCWRIGTAEMDNIWEEYTQSPELIEGCAIETTVGQLLRALPSEPGAPTKSDGSTLKGEVIETPAWNISFTTDGCNIQFGACKYQQDVDPLSGEPAGWTSAIAFFKGEDHDNEMEFRVLINPYFDNLSIEPAPDGTPQTVRPDLGEKKYRKLPAATKWMTNRIVLAPNVTQDERNAVEDWLDDFGVMTGSSPNADLEIIESTDTGSTLEDNYDYAAELSGLANYEGSAEPLEEAMERFLTKRDWEKWPVVDLVEINSDNAGTFIEAYWHRSEDPAFEMSAYGHDDFQRVWVQRYTDPTEEPILWKNTLAEEFEEKE